MCKKSFIGKLEKHLGENNLCATNLDWKFEGKDNLTFNLAERLHHLFKSQEIFHSRCQSNKIKKLCTKINFKNMLAEATSVVMTFIYFGKYFKDKLQAWTNNAF